jgi:hypothetical protein
MRYFLAGHFAVPVPSGVIERGRVKKLNDMLSMGLRKPWQDALTEIAGQRKMDANAVRDYFAPLQKWLDEQNKGKPVDW